jgi:hypothetical protein
MRTAVSFDGQALPNDPASLNLSVRMTPHTSCVSSDNPFKGRAIPPAPPMTVLHRFTKSGHRVEILERRVTQFRAVEFFVFVDGALLESQMFHNGREDEYTAELDARIKQFVDAGWIERPEAPDVREKV